MDIREHSVTLVSVIVGLGLTEMLGNLHRLIRARGRVRSERYHWCAAIVVLALTMYRMTFQVLR